MKAQYIKRMMVLFPEHISVKNGEFKIEICSDRARDIYLLESDKYAAMTSPRQVYI